jgi:DNA-binding NarL/FixJ family response regulator
LALTAEGQPILGVTPDDEHAMRRDTASMRARVLIVDDHDGFRAVARVLLESEGFDVVGEAADGGSAVDAAAVLRPDIVLLDVHLPDSDGFSIARQLAGQPEPPVVVLVSSRPIADLRRRVRDSPAVGFLAKDELSGAAVTAIVG